MSKQDQNYYEKLTKEALESISNVRTKEIISLRFGLNNGKRQTLEATGKKYNITRERVRQIEEAAFSVFKNPSNIKKFKPVFKQIDNFFKKEGGLVKEERLFSEMTQADSLNSEKGNFYFILTLNPSCDRFVETDKFYPCWVNSKKVFSKAGDIVSKLAEYIKQDGKPLKFEDIYKFSKTQGYSLTKRALNSYLDASKIISKNTFNEYGLSKWSEISPRGAKDKAYIILKQQRKPLHFKEVAQFISEAGLGNNPAQPQTVHNELIKDNRFILVGRGTYALEEWGYKKGTVKEVIAQILKEKGPLSREEVINEVSKNRYAKPNTILINLQNRKHFIRDEEGKYRLK